jgi:antitoxin (DNA-binding transcriptional repressor) of toxin-antitoxin stability system
MTVKVSDHELREQLAELLDEVVKNGAECVVQRDGKDCAVIVNIRQWRRRALGQRLDAMEPAYRLSKSKQARAEQLLAARARRSLVAKERQELQSLLRESDAIMVRRAAAVERCVSTR